MCFCWVCVCSSLSAPSRPDPVLKANSLYKKRLIGPSQTHRHILISRLCDLSHTPWRNTFMVFLHVCTCVFLCTHTLLLMTDEMDPHHHHPPHRLSHCFYSQRNEAPRLTLTPWYIADPLLPTRRGGKVTATVPLQAASIPEQIPIQFPSHSKERQLGVLLIFFYFLFYVFF